MQEENDMKEKIEWVEEGDPKRRGIHRGEKRERDFFCWDETKSLSCSKWMFGSMGSAGPHSGS